jgi:hypothetical protein
MRNYQIRFYNEELVLPRWPGEISAIDILAVPNLERQHDHFLVLNVTDQPIVTDTAAPQALFFPVQWLAPLPRVVRGHQAPTQKTLNKLLVRAAEFCNLLFRGTGDFNPPGLTRRDQGGALTMAKLFHQLLQRVHVPMVIARSVNRRLCDESRMRQA